MTPPGKKPDKKKAMSILRAAEKDMRFTLSLKVTEESANTMVRNIYECFRMLGEALLVAKGVRSEDHVTTIKELYKLNVNTERPIYLIDSLRKLRHSINYYGYKPRLAEVEDAVSIAESCFGPLSKAVLAELAK